LAILIKFLGELLRFVTIDNDCHLYLFDDLGVGGKFFFY